MSLAEMVTPKSAMRDSVARGIGAQFDACRRAASVAVSTRVYNRRPTAIWESTEEAGGTVDVGSVGSALAAGRLAPDVDPSVAT